MNICNKCLQYADTGCLCKPDAPQNVWYVDQDPAYAAVRSALILLAVLLSIFVVGGVVCYLWITFGDLINA